MAHSCVRPKTTSLCFTKLPCKGAQVGGDSTNAFSRTRTPWVAFRPASSGLSSDATQTLTVAAPNTSEISGAAVGATNGIATSTGGTTLRSETEVLDAKGNSVTADDDAPVMNSTP